MPKIVLWKKSFVCLMGLDLILNELSKFDILLFISDK